MATRTIISQFAKFKRIDFGKFFGEGKQIRFYKNDNFDDLEPEEFLGPYIVPKGMLEYIIANGKLRVTNINSYNFLPDDHSTDIKECGEMNSLEAFCTLFLDKEIQIPDELLNNNLLVEKFEVYEPAMSIHNNLEGILAIDAVELEISYRDNLIVDCSQFKSQIIANNTTKKSRSIVNSFCNPIKKSTNLIPFAPSSFGFAPISNICTSKFCHHSFIIFTSICHLLMDTLTISIP